MSRALCSIWGWIEREGRLLDPVFLLVKGGTSGGIKKKTTRLNALFLGFIQGDGPPVDSRMGLGDEEGVNLNEYCQRVNSRVLCRDNLRDTQRQNDDTVSTYPRESK